MKDSTIIRILELVCGLVALIFHVIYDVDHMLMLCIAVLWGIPLNIIIEKRRKSSNVVQVDTSLQKD